MNRRTNLLSWLLALAPCLLLAGCGGSGRVATIDHNRIDLEAALVKVEKLEASVVALETTIGEIKIGGGGDSITAWIYAVIAGGAVLGGTIYPAVIRPLRKRKERNGKRD